MVPQLDYPEYLEPQDDRYFPRYACRLLGILSCPDTNEMDIPCVIRSLSEQGLNLTVLASQSPLKCPANQNLEVCVHTPDGRSVVAVAAKVVHNKHLDEPIGQTLGLQITHIPSTDRRRWQRLLAGLAACNTAQGEQPAKPTVTKP